MNRMIEQANQYGKHDMERLGLFIEMPYMNGKGYVSPFPKPRVDKGRNIMCEGRKLKNGTQHGYFDDTFRRLFEGEGIARPPKRASEEQKKKKKGKAVSDKPFMPAGFPKWHCCPGDHYGTFGGIIQAFSRVARPKPPYVKEKPNCLTNPGKKGGPGYPHICLSKYPEYISSPYRPKIKYKVYGTNLSRAIVTVHYPQPFFDKNPYFEEKLGRVYIAPKERPHAIIGDGKWIPTGPAKWQGGCHAGLFAPFPEHMTNRNRRKEEKEREAQKKKRKAVAEGGIFGPQSMALKKMFTSSVLLQNTGICVNATNYKTYEPTYTKRLLA